MDIIDDVLESLAGAEVLPSLAPVTRILREGGPAPVDSDDGPLATAFADLWRRTRTGMSQAWCSRVENAWQECVESMPWEASNRARGTPPTLESYLAHRATAGATYLALLLNEALEKVELPDRLYFSGPLTCLRSMACDHICWVNDLLSLEREEAHGDVHNLVLVLESAYGYDRPHALKETTRMANERMAMIRQLLASTHGYQTALQLNHADVRLMDHYADTLLNWIAGSLDFHLLSTRHRDYRTAQANPFRAAQAGDGQ